MQSTPLLFYCANLHSELPLPGRNGLRFHNLVACLITTMYGINLLSVYQCLTVNTLSMIATQTSLLEMRIDHNNTRGLFYTPYEFKQCHYKIRYSLVIQLLSIPEVCSIKVVAKKSVHRLYFISSVSFYFIIEKYMQGSGVSGKPKCSMSLKLLYAFVYIVQPFCKRKRQKWRLGLICFLIVRVRPRSCCLLLLHW